MDYNDFVNAVENLGYFEDRERAESAVKAALGILASRLEEDEARALTADLPDPLTFEKLRGHQANVTDITFDQYIAELAIAFGLDEDEAHTLVNSVFHLMKDSLEEGVLDEVEGNLPRDWATAMRRA